MKLLTNAHIYTLDRNKPIAKEILIDHGVILDVGKNGRLLKKYNQCCNQEEHIDLGGSVIIPGLIDAHIHLKNYARSLQIVDCETGTLAECLDRLAEMAKTVSPGEWILGHGWNQNLWQSSYGTLADLDRVVPDNPVYLTAKSLHAAWANSLAFKLSNINHKTSDPSGGRIMRDSSGLPSGILLESAMSLVASRVPETSLETIKEQIYKAQLQLWKMGVTGAHDFDQSDCFQALQILDRENRLRLRVVKSIPHNDLEHAISLGLRSGFGNDYLRIGSLKLFADGALGPRTAAMLSPYEEEPDNLGVLMLDEEEIFEIGCLAVSNGISLAVHAIGDRANHEVLNAFAHLREYEKNNNIFDVTQFGTADKNKYEQKHSNPLRHRIEHVQVIHPDDIPRLSRLNIIASMQPVHATSDMNMVEKYWGARAEYSYAWESIRTSKSKLAFGSDAPVEFPNPFWGIHAAATRQRRMKSEESWFENQTISVEEAVRGYTTYAAFAGGNESKVGRLSPGMLADLVVLDRDILNCLPSEIWQVEPLATMIGGDWVYQKEP